MRHHPVESTVIDKINLLHKSIVNEVTGQSKLIFLYFCFDVVPGALKSKGLTSDAHSAFSFVEDKIGSFLKLAIFKVAHNLNIFVLSPENTATVGQVSRFEEFTQDLSSKTLHKEVHLLALVGLKVCISKHVDEFVLRGELMVVKLKAVESIRRSFVVRLFVDELYVFHDLALGQKFEDLNHHRRVAEVKKLTESLFIFIQDCLNHVTNQLLLIL